MAVRIPYEPKIRRVLVAEISSSHLIFQRVR
jgi:hypothetical protein